MTRGAAAPFSGLGHLHDLLCRTFGAGEIRRLREGLGQHLFECSSDAASVQILVRSKHGGQAVFHALDEDRVLGEVPPVRVDEACPGPDAGSGWTLDRPIGRESCPIAFC